MKLKSVLNISFDDGLFHVMTSEDQEIPFTIEYPKHRDRDFILYNCTVIEKKEVILPVYGPDFGKKLQTRFDYKISYEKKFTSKSLSEVQSSFKIYTRDEKLNSIL